MKGSLLADSEAPLGPASISTTTTTTTTNMTPMKNRSASDFRAEESKRWGKCSTSLGQFSFWPGAGLLGESYMLFSMGTLLPLWQQLFPSYFGGSSAWAAALTYTVVGGILVGMMTFGMAAQYMGRRRGSIGTATLMMMGALGLTLIAYCVETPSDSSSSIGRVALPMSIGLPLMVLSFAILGIGIGGEYPLAACSAAEKSMEDEEGETVPIVQDNTLVTAATPHGNDARGDPPGRLGTPLLLDHSKEEEGVAARSGKEIVSTPRKQKTSMGRGQRMQWVFSMQGLGIFVHSALLTLFLMILAPRPVHPDDDDNHHHDDDDDQASSTSTYAPQDLMTIWRIMYTTGTALLLAVWLYRLFFLQESQVWQQQQQQQQHAQQQQQSKPLSSPAVGALTEQRLERSASTDPAQPGTLSSSTWSLLLRYYGVRLLGTSLCWFLWDAFYGNKLFQSSFLLALTGENTTLLQFSAAATLNAGVALAGYYGAALLIDQPWMGRRNLQVGGFLLTGTLFVSCAYLYRKLSPNMLVALYLGSSFFGQLGPNATTFIVPAEIFPTEIRTLGHGVAAACGKLGALVAALSFHHVHDTSMFLLAGYASLAAGMVTMLTIPETVGLDLMELDRQWKCRVQGRGHEYRGAAHHPQYLSMYERYVEGQANQSELAMTSQKRRRVVR